MLNYRKGLADMPAYDVAERDWRLKLNANEAPTGLPPLVEERVMARLSRVAFNRYPNQEMEDLIAQVAQNYSLQDGQIFFGNGSSEIIEKLFFAFGGARHTIVYPEPSFSMYRIYVKASDTKGVPVGLEEDYSLDREKFVRAVQENKASLAVACNPNNPTGTLIPLENIEYIAQNISCAFIVDEAYLEFAGENASAVPLLAKYPHLIVARTFSKAYGLAAARVGYMMADAAVVDMTKKAFMPYHLNVLSLVTADIVYQMRDEFLPRVYMLRDECRRVTEALKTIAGLTVYPSHTNFILMKCKRAETLNAHLTSQGIGVRSFGSAPRLENCL
ncbi:MAG: aminotransferase class I/II-fold pyridoxal phosphate-dependent enzyme, partial [Schwartzia sp.]|nr:aminotransferase class I/II-fold pyridoxal phosphate-dependent enzyme [Schwartzia sp. (in: firmicutes)]